MAVPVLETDMLVFISERLLYMLVSLVSHLQNNMGTKIRAVSEKCVENEHQFDTWANVSRPDFPLHINPPDVPFSLCH
jgi:hypothetical protein